MQETELIPVYIKIGKRGITECICARDRKGCDRNCPTDFVTRDRFYGWKTDLYRDRFGRSRDAPYPKKYPKEGSDTR